MILDFENIRTSKESQVFSGRRRGEACRKKFDLERLDRLPGTVEVHIPADTYSVNSAFFLGCFGESVRALGKERFFNKYIFVCSDVILEEFLRYADIALKNAIPLG